MWTLYEVRWDFITPVCASTPADPDIIKAWIKAREPRVKPPGGKSIDEINEEVLASLERGEGEPSTEYSMRVFQAHQGVLCVRSATIRAHIKDCARVLSAQYVGRVEGERAFSTKVVNGVYLDEHVYWVPLLRPDGAPVTKPDGTRDKPIHPRGPRGQQIDALKQFEFLEPARLDFRLKVLGESVKEDDLHKIFTYGGVHGYGGERSDGEGKYTYRLVRVAGGRAADPHAGGAAPQARAGARRHRA